MGLLLLLAAVALVAIAVTASTSGGRHMDAEAEELKRAADRRQAVAKAEKMAARKARKKEWMGALKQLPTDALRYIKLQTLMREAECSPRGLFVNGRLTKDETDFFIFIKLQSRAELMRGFRVTCTGRRKLTKDMKDETKEYASKWEEIAARIVQTAKDAEAERFVLVSHRLTVTPAVRSCP